MNRKPLIQVILGSSRKLGNGSKFIKWIMEELNKRGDANFELQDLAEWNLPHWSDERHPSMLGGKYDDPLMQKWATTIGNADGFLIVTPEYNHGYPSTLKAALDIPSSEWGKKPVGFFSYGADAGGSRAVEQLREVIIQLRMVPTNDAVLMTNIWEKIDANGEIIDKETWSRRLNVTADEIIWWTGVLTPAREQLQKSLEGAKA